MRLITLDTETTGGAPARGDRCVEIGLVEMIDGAATGRTWQAYVNPGIPINYFAQKVHGITSAFLADKPSFADVAGDMLAFIDGAPCLAHNARFDRDMLMHDFRAAGLPLPRLKFHCTLPFAKAEVPAPSYNMDSLALALGIVTEKRGLHGALSDAVMLAGIVATIEERNPGAIARRIRPDQGISPYPSGWKVAEPVLPGLRPADRAGEASADLVHRDPAVDNRTEKLKAVIAEVNEQTGPMDERTFRKLRSGFDQWSSVKTRELSFIVANSSPGFQEEPAFQAMAPGVQNAALRWVCRGLLPERVLAWNEVRASLYEVPSRWAVEDASPEP